MVHFSSYISRLAFRGDSGSFLFVLRRRGNVNKTKIIHAVYSTAEFFNILLEEFFIFFEKLCDIVAKICVSRCNQGTLDLGQTVFRHSWSFFRRSSGLLWLLLSLLLFGFGSRRRRSSRCFRSRSGCRSRLWSGLGHRCRRGSRLILGDLTIGNIIHLIGKDHALTFVLRLFCGLFVIICKRHFVVFFFVFVLVILKMIRVDGENHIGRLILLFLVEVLGINGKNHIGGFFFLVTVNILGVDRKDHVYGLFSRLFLCRSLFCHGLFSRLFLCRSLLCYGLFSRLFLYGSLFCYGLFLGLKLYGHFLYFELIRRCFFFESFLCYGLFCRLFLYGRFLCYGLFCRLFLYGSFLCYRLFSRLFLYGSLFCYGLFGRCFLYGSLVKCLFLSLLCSKTLLYLVK